uniref:Patatin n=1 Tax=Oryza barthii TaxID=65489 RepID=A0A0D3FGC7_9ORYZ
MEEAEEMQVERMQEEVEGGGADTDKLSYEIFSILESKFLFGCGCPMRALLAGRALAHLEAALRRASGDPDARVADYFDLVAGTGAGGVFAAMLFSTHSRGAPLFHADDTWRLVADHAPRLFRKAVGGAGRGHEDGVRRGAHPAGHHQARAHLLLRPQVVRAARHEFPFVRGVEDLLVLSIGGCSAGGTGAAADADLRRLRRWGPKDWARPIARIAADGAADLVDHAVARAFGQCRSSNYLRIQAKRESMPPCGPDGEYDPTPANVHALLAAADEMLKHRNVESVLFEGRRVGEQTNAERLDCFAAELVAEHRSRGSRIGPTVAFKQAPRKQPPAAAVAAMG